MGATSAGFGRATRGVRVVRVARVARDARVDGCFSSSVTARGASAMGATLAGFDRATRGVGCFSSSSARAGSRSTGFSNDEGLDSGVFERDVDLRPVRLGVGASTGGSSSTLPARTLLRVARAGVASPDAFVFETRGMVRRCWLSIIGQVSELKAQARENICLTARAEASVGVNALSKRHMKL